MAQSHSFINQLVDQEPLIEVLVSQRHLFWINDKKQNEVQIDGLSLEHVKDAEKRLKRFATYFMKKFPITKITNGILESDIKEIGEMKKLIEGRRGIEIPGKLYLKCDHSLPIAGSVKARGGIYEVLVFAEKLALEHGLCTLEDDYEIFDSEKFRALFSEYTIIVGSTGNLGLSIGTIGATLGFNVTVHMSAEAKEWKKELLRSKGVNVIEHRDDYSAAVAAGRAEAEKDSKSHFVDDENSRHLFYGYAVAALRIRKQLEQSKIKVDEDHPLFVYLPCGVGGAPGGIAYGLKSILGEHVHIFFVEPIQSPCMTLGLMTGLHDEISVHDLGLSNKTEADGLAVARPSKFVGKAMETIISGCITVDDSFLYRSLKAMYEKENIFMEPSAHAAVYGPIELIYSGNSYIKKEGLMNKMEKARHLVWSTGGDLVPHHERQIYLQTEI
jgi:D-serine dehydratase